MLMPGCCEIQVPLSAAFVGFCQNESGDLLLPLCYSYHWSPFADSVTIALTRTSTQVAAVSFTLLFFGTSRTGLTTPSQMSPSQEREGSPSCKLLSPRSWFARISQMATLSSKVSPSSVWVWVSWFWYPPFLTSNPRGGGCPWHLFTVFPQWIFPFLIPL